MKYSVFALFALGLIFLNSCQNTPSGTSPGADLAPGSSSISSVAPAAEPKLLSEQILTDYLAAQKELKQYEAANEENFQMIRSMKMSWGRQGEEDKKHIGNLVQETIKFFEVYQKQQEYTSQLDSLSGNVMAGTISIEDAQKKYLAIREALQGVSSKLQSGEEKMKAVKSEWERDFPALSKQQ